MLSHQILIDHLEYDEITGVFTRKIATARSVSAVVTSGTLRRGDVVKMHRD